MRVHLSFSSSLPNSNCTHHSSSQFLTPFRLALVLFISFVFLADVHAQPVLDFKKISVNWPSVELMFNVKCGGNFSYGFSKRNFHVTENGIPVQNFTLTCSDTSKRFTTSIALVFDRSGSMGWDTPSRLSSAKKAGEVFVHALDPFRDEAAVISFSTGVKVDQKLTNDTTKLITAIRSLVAQGGTAIWDGAYYALEELVTKGTGALRVVVLLTDGEDNASAVSVDDVIALAKGNGVFVYTIALGTGINSTLLKQLASETGGEFYTINDPNALTALYAQLARMIIYGNEDCKITYTGTCIDGGARDVALTIENHCGGSDTKRQTFIAPTNVGKTTAIDVALGTVQQRAAAEIAVPILLRDSLYNDLFYPFEMSVEYDKSCIDFVRVQSTPMSLLANASFSVLETPTGIFIRSNDKKIVTGRGVLAELVFKTHDPNDTTECPLQFTYLSFDAGCMMPRLFGGGVRTIPCRLSPKITTLSQPVFCSADSLRLDADPGYARYEWYWNGVKLPNVGQRIFVNRAGDYHVVVENDIGCIGQSQSMHVEQIASRNLAIGNDASLLSKFGDDVVLPILAYPPLDDRRSFDFSFVLRYDPTQFRYASIERNEAGNTWTALAAREESDGLHVQGSCAPRDSVRSLFTIRLHRLTIEKETERRTFSIEGCTVQSQCLLATSVIHPSVLLEGRCERIALKSAAPSITASPNPFNPTTVLSVYMPRDERARLSIFNVYGQELFLVMDEILPQNMTHLSVDASHLPAGLYIARLTSNSGVASAILCHVK